MIGDFFGYVFGAFCLLAWALGMFLRWLNDDGVVQATTKDGVVKLLSRWLK